MDLLGDSGDEEVAINTTNTYATKYDTWRQKEHLQKLKDKYGADYEEQESDSDESSEDSDAEEDNEEVEKDFFATLASLKNKDPKLYDGETVFFREKSETGGDGATESNKIKKEKKMTLKDVETKVMLEKGGHFDEMEDEAPKVAAGPSYHEEMKDIRDSFKTALEKEDEEDALLAKKPKSAVEKQKEEVEYKAWLAGQRSSLGDTEMEARMEGLRDFWNKDDLDEGEKFLKDFLLNKRFLDKNEDEEHVAEYDEVAHDSDEDLSEDEKNVEKMEEFEHKFNFRFEEPDEEFIKRYPRTIKGTMRKEEDKRAKKRKDVEERKKREKQQKKEEIKILKNAKKKEILDKLELLKKMTGNDDMGLDEDDIEGDFDPEKYDKKMKDVFSNYDEAGAGVDAVKPTFSDLEDEDFNMDCEYDASKATMEQELVEASRGRRKGRRKSKFAEALEAAAEKPVFDPAAKSFGEYVEEYYKLDCEDVIADVHCRFQYRDVPANSFGLSVEEVLGAKDSELNAWASLRKTCQYRTEEEERKDFHVFRNKAKDDRLKKKILPTLFDEEADVDEGEEEKKETEGSEVTGKAAKKKNKKKRKRAAAAAEETNGEAKKPKVEEEVTKPAAESSQGGEATESKSEKKKKKKNTLAVTDTISIKESKPAPVGGPSTKPGKKKRKSKGSSGPAIQVGRMAGIFERARRAPGQGRQGAPGHQGRQGGTRAPGHQARQGGTAAISDDRLKAYGINPSKFRRTLKKEFFKEKAAKEKD